MRDKTKTAVGERNRFGWLARRHLGSLALLAFLVPLLLPSGAAAATGVIKVLMDLDNNPSTGCTIATPAGPFLGADQVVVTTFDTSSNQVTSVQVQVCSAGTLGSPTPINGPFSPPWPTGAGNGVNGSTLIETYFPLAGTRAPSPIRVGFTVGDQQGDQDALLPIALITSGIAAAPVLSGLGLVVLVLSLLFIGNALLRRRKGALAFVGVLALAAAVAGVAWAAVALNGQTSDWTGISPLGTKPSTQPGHAEILAAYGVRQDSNLFFRVDAMIPTASSLAITSANQTAFTAGVAALFNVTTSGLPAPGLSETGALPAGVAFIGNGDGTGMLLGTAAAGTGGVHGGITLTAHNGAGPDAVQSFTLTVLEGAPSLAAIVDQTIPLGSTFAVRLSADDPNPGTALTYFLDAKPTGAAFNPNPIVQWTPTAAQLGSNTFTARVVDGLGHSDTKTFHVTVTPADQPPQLAAQPDQRIPDGVLFLRTLTATDPDAGDTLTFSLVSGPAGMSLVNGNQLSWTPATAQIGQNLVIVRVTDGAGASDSKLFALTVFAATKPVAQDDAYHIPVGQTLIVPPPGVLGNDTDPNGYPLTAIKQTDPDKGSLTAFNPDGSFTYQAPAAIPPPTFDVKRTRELISNGGGIVGTIGYYPPLVADMDGDGKPEIIAWRWDELHVLHGDTGLELFSTGGSFTSPLPPPYDACAFYGRGGDRFAVADVDDDGLPEIVMGVQCAADNDNYIYHAQGGSSRVAAIAYDATQPSKWKVKWLSQPLSPQAVAGDGHLYVPFSGQAYAVSFTIARLRPTEKPTVLLGQTFGGSNACGAIIPGKTDLYCRIVFALDGATGTVKTPYYSTPDDPASVQSYDAAYSAAYPAPVVADVDNDGALDILYEGTLWNLDGSVKRQFDGTASTGPATLDSVVVNLDGKPEMDIVTFNTARQSGPTGTLNAWRPDGTLLWSTPVPLGGAGTRLSVGDIDRSGHPSFLFGIIDKLWAVDYQGRVTWVHQFPLIRGDQVFINPFAENDFPVYDLDGDGVPEVVVQYGNFTLKFLRGDTGEEEASWSFPGSTDDSTQGTETPVVADIDGSGHASVIWYHQGYNLVQVMQGDSHPWRAAPTHLNQRAYWETNFNADGTVPLTYSRQTTDPRTNVFGGQPEAPYAVAPVPASQTAFTYTASSGVLESVPATVTINLEPANHPPIITSTPPGSWLTNLRITALTYQITATDPDPGDTVTFGLVSDCGIYATVDPVTGLLQSTFYGINNDVVCPIKVEAIDSHGARTSQLWLLWFTDEMLTVPDVVGLQLTAAKSALGTLLPDLRPSFRTGHESLIFDAAPAGQVIAQNPAGGSTARRETTVDLTISKGLQPRVVPNVVGKTLASAGTALAGALFSVGTTTYQFDLTQPRGTVLAQSPAAGLIVPPGPVALTVSASTGLELRLSRSFTTADVPITITPVAIDLAGNESPAPSLNYGPIAAIATPFVGPLPTRVGTTLTFDPATRGAFRVTASDPVSGHTASAEFAVTQPQIPGEDSQMAEFARLSEVFEGLSGLLRQAAVALAAHDDAAMRARLTDMVNLWRTINLEDLKLSTPFSPDAGFPPAIEDMAGFGVTPGPDDAVNKQLLIQTAADLQAWTDGLNANSTTLPQLQALAATFADHAGRLSSLSPGEYGAVDASPDYALIAGHRIPDLMEALMNELGSNVGLPARSGNFPGLLRHSGTKMQAPLTRSRFGKLSTLPELLVAQAVQYAIDTINTPKQYTNQVLKQAAEGAAIVAAAQHLRAFYQAQGAVVVSGASLSFREFNAPFAMIEGVGLQKDYPSLNTVILIGPDLINSVDALITKIKKAARFKLDPTDSAGNPRYKNLDQIQADLKKFKGLLEGVLGGAEGLANQAKKAFQSTTIADRPCLFTDDPTCVELLYPAGFHSVYTYSPPPGFGGFTGLPVPIAFIIRNNVNGQIVIDTPPFLPCSNTPQNPHNCD